MTYQASKPLEIMVAEDDDDDFLVFTVALEETSFSFRLSRAINGEVLMKLLQEQIPDLLFLDIFMPCKDGYKCLKEIRKDKRYDSLPVIVYSSLNEMNSVEQCFRDGSNFYLIKPHILDDLKSVLEKILTIDWKSSLYYPARSEFLLHPPKASAR